MSNCPCKQLALCSYLVTERTLLGADVGDQVSGLFGHFVQKHVAQRQASIPYVVTLRRRVGRDKKTQSEIIIKTA